MAKIGYARVSSKEQHLMAKELRDIDQQINENEKELVWMLKELTSSDDDIMAGLQSIIEDFEEEIR